MFLVTRPNFTATREQVLDELWPDADPTSASNSLNQSLFFIRRDIDPWYEDDLSLDYLRFEGDLVWIDGDLVRVASAEFLTASRELSASAGSEEVLEVVSRYTGQFAPEFEYEEWAIGWRTRVHAAYLEFVIGAIDRLTLGRAFEAARDVASRALAVDPEAREIEESLIRVYWRLGARSAARAQFEHLAANDRRDGLDSPSFEELAVAGENE
jgi:DNA-binding SARP family transcriptional activator